MGNKEGKVYSVKLFDKASTEGGDAAMREFKNLKTLRHEKMVSLVDVFETDRFSLLQFSALPSTDVLSYISERPFKGESPEETKDNILNVKFKFEYLYKECTMEGTRLLMWVFKKAPIRRPSLEEVGAHRWMNAADYMLKKRERARFPTN